MSNPDGKIERRKFLQDGAVMLAGSAALSSTALSYSRIAGANDRIALGHIGIGSRGSELDSMAGQLKDRMNVEMVAVCDLWTKNRERAVTANQKYYGRAPVISAPCRVDCFGKSGRNLHLGARARAFAAIKDGGGGEQGRLLRKADGECVVGSSSGARRGAGTKKSRGSNRHATSQ